MTDRANFGSKDVATNRAKGQPLKVIEAFATIANA